ncbi:MAG: lysozyme [Betaproteobacteria bacterium]|nr:lysozyme [Betaproteobacteria bacterium]
MPQINQATVDLIKRWEGCELTAYQDQVGVWTIGYGVTAAAGLGIEPGPGMTITQAQADDLLMRGLQKFSAEIWPHITAPVNDNQAGACLSLAWNIGAPAFEESTCLRRLNDGDYAGAAEALTWWNKAGGVVSDGLVNRRADEKKLFLTPC